MPVLWHLFDAFRPILKHGMKLAEIEEPCLQALHLAIYAIKNALLILNWWNKNLWGWNCWVWRNPYSFRLRKPFKQWKLPLFMCVRTPKMFLASTFSDFSSTRNHLEENSPEENSLSCLVPQQERFFVKWQYHFFHFFVTFLLVFDVF